MWSKESSGIAMQIISRTAETSASESSVLDERKLLLTRINHLDSLTVTVRNIGIPVFLVVFGACASVKFGNLPLRKAIPFDVEFVLPLAIALGFFLMEVRIRSKYVLCKDRWNMLLRRAENSALKGADLKQAAIEFDWVDRHRDSLRSGLHLDLLVVYSTMVLVTAAAWYL
jgi:hypothetical protein